MPRCKSFMKLLINKNILCAISHAKVASLNAHKFGFDFKYDLTSYIAISSIYQAKQPHAAAAQLNSIIQDTCKGKNQQLTFYDF